jgi:hypothetical protein
VLFHQRHPQPPGRRVQRYAGTGDAAADDEHVERFAIGERRQFRAAARRVQGGRVVHQDKYPRAFSPGSDRTAPAV